MIIFFADVANNLRGWIWTSYFFLDLLGSFLLISYYVRIVRFSFDYYSTLHHSLVNFCAIKELTSLVLINFRSRRSTFERTSCRHIRKSNLCIMGTPGCRSPKWTHPKIPGNLFPSWPRIQPDSRGGSRHATNCDSELDSWQRVLDPSAG